MRTPILRDKKIRYLAFAVAFVGMGMTMPSCPGQQAMQQQIDSMHDAQIESNRKVVTYDTQIKALMADSNNLKQAVEALNKALQDQAKQTNDALKALDEKIIAMSKAPAKRSKRH